MNLKLSLDNAQQTVDGRYGEACAAIKRLQDAGHEAYLVGGCVRDIVLGKNPKDYDVVTSALPEQVKALFTQHAVVGESFGIIMATEFSQPIEIATYREDGSYGDGRRPDSVAFSTKEKDVERRDFTMNGMLLDPTAAEVIDLVGGLDDLHEGIIKTIGNPEQRFSEDYLRLMRAIRFAAQLDFIIPHLEFNTIRKLAPNIQAISAERIREELMKILSSTNADYGIHLLYTSGLMQHILPEVAATVDVKQSPKYHPEITVYNHLLLAVGSVRVDDPLLKLAALLHDIGKSKTRTFDGDKIHFYGHETVSAEMAKEIMTRLKFSSEEIDIVSYLVGQHMTFMSADLMRRTRLHHRMSHELFPTMLELLWADAEASNKDFSDYDFLKKELEENKITARRRELTKPLLMGRDLIELGLQPGPLMGKILKEVEEKRLEEVIKTREEAINYVTINYRS